MLLLLLWAAPGEIPRSIPNKLVQQWFSLLIPFMFLLVMLLDQASIGTSSCIPIDSS